MYGSFLSKAAVIASSLTPISPGGLPQSTAANSSQIQNILGILFGLLGALSLLYIVIAGFRYIISSGDPQKTAKAKSGIIYALVGLIVAIFAEAIVAFVIGKL